jgi:hypothetical protein
MDDVMNTTNTMVEVAETMETANNIPAPTPVIPTPIVETAPIYPVAMPETGAGRAKYYALGAGIGLGLVGIGVGGYFLTKFIIKKHNEKKAAEDIVDSDDFLDEEVED